jgi:Ser/Thr protein kinase RdoA (MazF antagonist)
VYRVGVEPLALHPVDERRLDRAVVVKFYRPNRWSDAQILEEHAFAMRLQEAELNVAAPVSFEGRSLHHWDGHRYAVFDCWRGVAPDLDRAGDRPLLGRSLARLHAVGRRFNLAARAPHAGWRAGSVARQAVLESRQLPPEMAHNYARASGELLASIREVWERCGPVRNFAIHGDCHPGNVLWNAQGPVFVDLDDCLMAPPIQDLWMLVAGSAAERSLEWRQLLEGYTEFGSVDALEFDLIESLRGLRMLAHAAWISDRWLDPAFPRAFPWFGEARYWERHIAEIWEQLEAVTEPPKLEL